MCARNLCPASAATYPASIKVGLQCSLTAEQHDARHVYESTYMCTVPLPDLEGVEFLPWQPPRHHLPHDDAKRVHISCLAVVMLLHHLWSTATNVEYGEGSVSKHIADGIVAMKE